MSANALGLYEILEHIRRAIALNFSESLWVRAEIAQLRESRGHVFLELIEKEEGAEDWIAQASAVIWANTHRTLRSKLADRYSVILQEGAEILCKVRVDFHERYGLKLLIEEIDPAYTVGLLALERQRKYEELVREGLPGKNAALPLPLVLQRIAVLSSPQAAGWQDFEQQLRHNPYGYHFSCRLFPAAMQGSLLEGEVLAQLSRIGLQKDAFDCVVIIRGGGSKLDLAGFDSLEVCRAIARFPLPVLTGIGHDVDETLSDRMAFEALKTPTAVAEYLIQRNMLFEQQILEAWRLIQHESVARIREQQLILERMGRILQQAPLSVVHAAQSELKLCMQKIPLLTRQRLDTASNKLDAMDHMIRLLSIEHTLQRGFSLTLMNGSAVSHPDEVKKGDLVTTILADGRFNSEVL